MKRRLMHVVPDGWFYADHLTWSARRLLMRIAIGVSGIIVGLAAAGLLSATNWREVLAGALLAWGVSLVVWASTSYRHERGEMHGNLRDTAEFDLLHARLNQLAVRLDAPRVNLDWLIDEVLTARMERLAHFGGLDEFRGQTSKEGHAFWDDEALGRT